jgi:dihydrofolate reductase
VGKVIYYLAMTVDAKIAGPGGDLGWLLQYEHTGEDYGYKGLVEGLDALIMGASTYEWVLDHGEAWAYEGLESIVMTTRSLPQPAGGTVLFTAESPEEVVRSLKAKHQKNIWLVGGGKLAAAFAEADLIEEYDLTLIPIVLGAGIPLLEPVAAARLQRLTLFEHRVFPSGVVRLRYERTSPPGPLS